MGRRFSEFIVVDVAFAVALAVGFPLAQGACGIPLECRRPGVACLAICINPWRQVPQLLLVGVQAGALAGIITALALYLLTRALPPLRASRPSSILPILMGAASLWASFVSLRLFYPFSPDELGIMFGVGAVALAALMSASNALRRLGARYL